MFFFKEKEPEMVEIKGHYLTCPVCANKYFQKKRTTIQAIFSWYVSANCYICSECNYIYWFKHIPETQQ